MPRRQRTQRPRAYLPGASDGKSSRDSKSLSRWQDVLKKMQAEGFAMGGG